MHALIIDGKIFACPMADWQATGSFLFLSCVCFLRDYWSAVWSLNWLSFLKYTHKPHQQKKESIFFIILRQKRVFVIRENSSIFIKKVFKILPLSQIATWRRNFETCAMLDCHCYGQHLHENKPRTEIRREPFIRAVFILEKTCSYNGTVHILCYTHLIFSLYKWP